MTDPDAITAFILARIGEEEEAARAASEAPPVPADAHLVAIDTRAHWGATYHPDHPHGLPRRVAWWTPRGEQVPVADTWQVGAAEYIARKDPADTLARCAELRELVSEVMGDGWEPDPAGFMDYRAVVLRHVARIVRLRPGGTEHPEWRKEWE